MFQGACAVQSTGRCDLSQPVSVDGGVDKRVRIPTMIANECDNIPFNGVPGGAARDAGDPPTLSIHVRLEIRDSAVAIAGIHLLSTATPGGTSALEACTVGTGDYGLCGLIIGMAEALKK